MAQGAANLRQIAAGTYREGELDIDAANARFLEAMRDVPLRPFTSSCRPRTGS